MKINFNIIKKISKKEKTIKRISVVIAQHFLLTNLFLFIISILLGGILFYQYAILAQEAEQEFIKKQSLLKEDIYNDVLRSWQEQQLRFNETDLQEYNDPFKKPIQTQEKNAPK